MNQARAKQLYKKQKALFIAFQEAYQVFRPAKEAWDEAFEIYKGVAIHFKETQHIVLDAESIGVVKKKRKVWCNYHNIGDSCCRLA